MKKSYYISQTGELMYSPVFGEPYILINCGTELMFKKEKVRKLLLNRITYTVDISEESVAEIHYSTPPFSRDRYLGIKNLPSDLSVKKFLSLIT